MGDEDRRVSLDISPELNTFGVRVWAIRAFNGKSEFMTVDAIDSLRNCGTVVLPAILNSMGGNNEGFMPLLKIDDQGVGYTGLLNEFANTYHLNDDQVAVCKSVLDSLGSSCKSPITLVHGGLWWKLNT